MSEQNPVVKHYLQKFRESLGQMDEPEKNEVVTEIESHIAEAVQAGRSVADTLERLGSAEKLAKAYTVELLLKPSSGPRLKRWATIVSVVATTSLVSMVILAVLVGVGLGLTVAGSGVLLGGILSLFIPGLVESTFFPVPMAQFAAVLIGSIMTILGLLTLKLMTLYVRFVITTAKKVMAGL